MQGYFYNLIITKKEHSILIILDINQFDKDVISAVSYYLRYMRSYRDISYILNERGVNVHHSTTYFFSFICDTLLPISDFAKKLSKLLFFQQIL